MVLKMGPCLPVCKEMERHFIHDGGDLSGCFFQLCALALRLLALQHLGGISVSCQGRTFWLSCCS